MLILEDIVIRSEEAFQVSTDSNFFDSLFCMELGYRDEAKSHYWTLCKRRRK